MIQLEIEGIPPSANNAYFNHPRGGRVLSKDGKKFKKETSAFIVQKYFQELGDIKANHPYGIMAVFYLPNLENKGFKLGKAQTRYKRIDTSNRVKLLEDALVDAIDVDDSNFMFVGSMKKWGEKEKTVLLVWDARMESLSDVAARLLTL
jgi:Holliday junction resolvase RusA-like endonuclease